MELYYPVEISQCSDPVIEASEICRTPVGIRPVDPHWKSLLMGGMAAVIRSSISGGVVFMTGDFSVLEVTNQGY